MKRVALATVILSAIALTARAQPPRTGSPPSSAVTVTVTGRVVADHTGNPIANARVTVAPGATAAPVVMTDREGRFAIAVPVSGRSWVSASKSGYGHRESDPITRETTIEIRLPRAAVIAGRVVDSYGDPVPGVRVAVERAPASGPRTIVARSETDDRGDYRIGSLPPGTYAVAATGVGAMERRVMGPNQIAMLPSMHEIYFPGTEAAADAETIALRPGDERPTLDFVLPPGQSGSPFTMVVSPLENPADAVARWTGIIRGRVVSSDGRPVPRAELQVLGGLPASTPDRATTTPPIRFFPVTIAADEDGRFAVEHLPAGRFRIMARKAGYSMPGQELFGPGALAGVDVELRDGEVRERVDITMAHWGSLSGRIVDELNEPLQGVSVQLMQVRYQAGRRRLVGAGGISRVTDDRGRFRTYGLAPGKYIVSASVGLVLSADIPGYALTYFPGTPNAGEAQFVTVGLSQEVSGIDFELARAPTALISGTLRDASGAASTQGSVRLVPAQRSASAVSLPLGARLTPDGRFEFPNVTPGQYVIQVDRGRRGSAIEGEFGALPVSVNGVDVKDLMLQTSTGSSIAGHVTFDSYLGAPAPTTRAIEIVPTVVDPDQSTANPASADIRSDWSFEVSGINGPRRLQVVRAPAEWTVREIRVRGTDVTDRPLPFGRADQSLTDVEIALTDRVNTISGTIADDHAKPVAGAHLVVFAIDRDRWYPASRFLRETTAGADGAVAMAGLPAGSYYAAAVATIPADGDDAWRDPAYLESLIGRAATIAFGEGQKQVLNLKLDRP